MFPILYNRKETRLVLISFVFSENFVISYSYLYYVYIHSYDPGGQRCHSSFIFFQLDYEIMYKLVLGDYEIMYKQVLGDVKARRPWAPLAPKMVRHWIE